MAEIKKTFSITQFTLEPSPQQHQRLLMKQFIKCPVAFYCNVNPRKTLLSFDGSNYGDLETVIDRKIRHAFLMENSFLKNLFLKSLNIAHNKAWNPMKSLLLMSCSTCYATNARDPVILINRLLKFATEQLLASEAWLAWFCAAWSDIKQAKITGNELGGLIIQALESAPTGVDAKNF
ncbi:hypothetical protein VP01_2654g4 [Puccinia sorghi]|uniref:Uncharacterized protein n=1 Tax=Puccinia sorghi TaxID=27349 RepID=A0A0L6V481_9BASI|nr:hypothetical protein VP01_2654g4 [Puccinia sorghi]